MIRVYTQERQGQRWLRRYYGHRPLLACVLGFTETGLLPGISAAGATPEHRRTTAIADAEFLYTGPQAQPRYPLPPLAAGISPALITRSLAVAQHWPVYLFDSGLPVPPPVPHIPLGQVPAQAVATGQALPYAQAQHLLRQGMIWGHRLANQAQPGYVVLGECVVGGTTTALAVLLGLGIEAEGRVSSSHPQSNHAQKAAIAQMGLAAWRAGAKPTQLRDPLALGAAVGDPMQIVVAGMALTASRRGGVLLAGGSQMLAVYALARAIAHHYRIPWQREQVVVGTTRWVVEDPSAQVLALAEDLRDVPLMATDLSFAQSRHGQLRKYEQGYVKEGLAAGGSAIAATLYQNWPQIQLLNTIEALVDQCQQVWSSPLAVSSDLSKYLSRGDTPLDSTISLGRLGESPALPQSGSVGKQRCPQKSRQLDNDDAGAGR